MSDNNEDEFQSILDRHKEPPAAEQKPGAIPEFHASAQLPNPEQVFDHSEEAEMHRQQERKLGVETPSYPEAATPTVIHPHVMVDPNTGSIFGQGPDGEEIRVDEQEAARFLKCMLHDEEMRFFVQPIAGFDVTVEVAAPTELFTTLASAMVDDWPYSSKSGVSWVLAMQQAHVWFSVRSIDGKPTKWSDPFADGIPKASFLREVLRNPEDHMSDIFNMNSARWSMLRESIRIAENKLKICVTAMKQRGFFEFGDTE